MAHHDINDEDRSTHQRSRVGRLLVVLTVTSVLSATMLGSTALGSTAPGSTALGATAPAAPAPGSTAPGRAGAAATDKAKNWQILKPTNTGIPGDYVYSIAVD